MSLPCTVTELIWKSIGLKTPTVTNCVAVALLPQESVAVHVRMSTLAIPLGNVSWNTILVIDPQLLVAVTFGADGGALRSSNVALQLLPKPVKFTIWATMKPMILV